MRHIVYCLALYIVHMSEWYTRLFYTILSIVMKKLTASMRELLLFLRIIHLYSVCWEFKTKNNKKKKESWTKADQVNLTLKLGTAPSGPGAATLVSLKIEARRSRRLNRIENKMRKTKRAAFSMGFLCILGGASQKIREKCFF